MTIYNPVITPLHSCALLFHYFSFTTEMLLLLLSSQTFFKKTFRIQAIYSLPISASLFSFDRLYFTLAFEKNDCRKIAFLCPVDGKRMRIGNIQRSLDQMHGISAGVTTFLFLALYLRRY
jgi:hypothetical protein